MQQQAEPSLEKLLYHLFLVVGYRKARQPRIIWALLTDTIHQNVAIANTEIIFLNVESCSKMCLTDGKILDGIFQENVV